MDPFYVVVRMIARFWIWFFFERVEVRTRSGSHPRVPVLLCINHPNNLIDSLLVGAVLPRKVHYLATAALFRNPVIARLLGALGAIPVYRKADDPARMDRNNEMFAACDEAFDRQGAHRHLSRRRHSRGGARATDQDGRGADRTRLRGARSSAPHRHTGRAQFRGQQEVSRACPRLVWRGRSTVSPYLAVYREEPAKGLHTAHGSAPVGDGARGRARRAHRHGGVRSRRGGALSRRARA